MNVLTYAAVLVAALFAKSGSFSFYAGAKKKSVVVTAAEHAAPLGKFSLAQAASIASAIAKGSGSVTVRVGADDYTLTVS